MAFACPIVELSTESDDPELAEGYSMMRTAFSFKGWQHSTMKDDFGKYCSATHPIGTTAKGTITITAEPRNEHNQPVSFPLFTPGTTFPACVRVANTARGKDTDGDARGFSLRIQYAPNHFHDIMMAAGLGFPTNNARDFVYVTVERAKLKDGNCTSQALMDFYHKVPQYKVDCLYSNLRIPKASYLELRYVSASPYLGVDANGKHYYVRYRAVGADAINDPEMLNGRYDRATWEAKYFGSTWCPGDPADARGPRYLRDEFEQRVRDGTCRAILQVQLHPVEDVGGKREALDCAMPWDDKQFPWVDVGEINLTDVVPLEESRHWNLNPINAHPSFSVPRPTSCTDYASILYASAISHTHSQKGRHHGLMQGVGNALSWGFNKIHNAFRGFHLDDSKVDAGQAGYIVQTVTGEDHGAGTNAKVFIRLFGGSKFNPTATPPIELDVWLRDDFKRGSLDNFVVQTVDVGTPWRIEIWVEGDDPWFCKRVEVTPRSLGAGVARFIVNEWIEQKPQNAPHFGVDAFSVQHVLESVAVNGFVESAQLPKVLDLVYDQLGLPEDSKATILQLWKTSADSNKDGKISADELDDLFHNRNAEGSSA